ncbi:MAG TPA: NAD-dependent deacylase [Saprospiraceae bacterium]|nr:NAD-dependent deacylase [Saprospiraceae bacterium]
MRKIAVLTGAGMSAESGISTFRDSNGLWENHDIMDVASPQGWQKNPKLVLQFYNERRRQLKEVEPNLGHLALKKLESAFEVTIITQNVDDLHERAGSSTVIHLHGELRKARSTGYPSLVYDWEGDINWGDLCERGNQLRPHIVWFSEDVPMLKTAADVVSDADIVLIIGTSLQVYPAAGLFEFAPPNAQIYYIDPKPQPTYQLSANPKSSIIEEKATIGVPALVDQLIQFENFI